MVVLNERSLAYQAACAMGGYHIGSVLVIGPRGLAGVVTDRDLSLAVLGGDLDPDEATLDEIMSEGVISCDIRGNVDEVARLMEENRIRRIPLTEDGRLAGLVTFDDLVLDGSVSIEMLQAIVTAPLEVEAPQKPAGVLYPQGKARPDERAAGRSRALMRAKFRANEVYNRLVRDVANHTELDFARSERALIVSLSVCSAAGWYPKRLFTSSPNFHQNYIRNLINASMDHTVLSVVMQSGTKSDARSVSINNKRL
jgi:hypothetical protein